MNLDQVIGNIGAYTRDAIVVADVDLADGATLRIRWVNPAFTGLTGYRPDEVNGRLLGMLAGPRTNAETHNQIIKRLIGWESFTEDIWCGRADGTPFWAQVTFQPLADATGIYRFWICVLRDITDRRETEDRLRDLSLIAQKTQDMVALLDAHRRITWVNDAFSGFTGYALPELRGLRLRDLLEADEADEAAVSRLVRTLDHGRAATAEILSRRKDGSRFLAHYEIRPIRNETGEVEKYISLIRDITERRTLEMRYKGVFDETHSLISIHDGDRFLMVNARFAERYDQPATWFVGRAVAEVRDAEERDKMREVEAKVLATGEPQVWERQRQDGFGQHQSFLTKTFHIFDPVLDRQLLCTVETDITEIRRTEARLRVAETEARAAGQRLLGAINAFPDGFVLYDAEDRIVMTNRAFAEMHDGIGPKIRNGMSYAELLDMGLDEGIWTLQDLSPEDWRAARLADRDAEEGVVFPLASGRWVLSKEVRLSTGERAGLRIDMTSVKRNEAALREAQATAERAQARLEAALTALGESLMIYDSEDRLIYRNAPTAYAPGSHDSQVVAGMRFDEIVRSGLEQGVFADAIGREDAWLKERMDARSSGAGPTEQRLSDGRIFQVVDQRTEHGDTVTLRIDITEMRAQQLKLEATARDLSESKRLLEDRNRALETARRELEHASRHDALTGLANRRYLDQELARRARDVTPGHQLAVLHIDLDRFKQINDGHGHDAGDHVLRWVARSLAHITRAGDFAARVGGDEFVILSETADGGRSVERLAGRLISALRAPLAYGGSELRVGASVGIAVAGLDGASHDAAQLLIQADLALYRAKDGGRNRYAVYCEELEAEVLSRNRLVDDLLRAVERREFEILYQPQFHADGRQLAGAEALIRWRHPERGLLHPGDFLQTAADMSLTRQIDQLVMSQALADDARWRALGLYLPKLSVNVSGARLRDASLLSDIRNSGIEPGRLSIELLESIFLDDEDEVVGWNIDQLRDMGVAIELDDFGTGHSSIIGLIRLKPARLKLDRHFIEQSLEQGAFPALIRSIVEIGHSLGVEVVAEGVETEPQAHLLAELGCDVLQGYAFAPPMSADAFAEYLRDLNPAPPVIALPRAMPGE